MRYATPGQLLRDLQPHRKTKEPVKAAKPLASFLSWLEAKPGAGVDPDGLTVPPETAPPKPKTIAKPAPAAAGSSEDATISPDANLLASMMKPTPAPAPKPATPPRATPAPPAAIKPAAAPLAKVPPKPPQAIAAAPTTPVPRPKTKAIVPRAEAPAQAGPVADPLETIWQFGWTKRDWISASIGSGVTLFVVLVIYLLIRLFS